MDADAGATEEAGSGAGVAVGVDKGAGAMDAAGAVAVGATASPHAANVRHANNPASATFTEQTPQQTRAAPTPLEAVYTADGARSLLKGYAVG